ncbi:hypothetical protein C8J57DRAFT_1704961 [Mycena rebaudengoi]|nr:hypothetical protein C8J57DRAFT_1704961 [Mycena rebaudengoi]
MPPPPPASPASKVLVTGVVCFYLVAALSMVMACVFSILLTVDWFYPAAQQ